MVLVMEFGIWLSEMRVLSLEEAELNIKLRSLYCLSKTPESPELDDWLLVGEAGYWLLVV
ncbi:uncharacterized protein ASCRUDRAFT_75285, partial [Ascoidea rubescens DSM 1968]